MSTINNWVINSQILLAICIVLVVFLLFTTILFVYLYARTDKISGMKINLLKTDYEMAYTELKKLRVLIAIKELGSGELSIKDLPNFFHEISRNLPDEHNDLIVRIALITIDSFHDKETFLHEVSNLLSNVTQIGVKIRVKDS